MKKILWTLDQLSDELALIWTQPSIDIRELAMAEETGTMGFALGMAMSADVFKQDNLCHRPGGRSQPLSPPVYAVRQGNTLYRRLSALERTNTAPNIVISSIGAIRKCDQHGPSSTGPL